MKKAKKQSAEEQIHYKHNQISCFYSYCWNCVFCFLPCLSIIICATMRFLPRIKHIQTNSPNCRLFKKDTESRSNGALPQLSQSTKTHIFAVYSWGKKDTICISQQTFCNELTHKQHKGKCEDSPSINLPGKQRESFKAEYCFTSTGF